jgi:tRNA(fMet)-specific endonuclease VapC
MAFYIDTNIWVAALRGRAPHVMERMLRHDPREIVVPHQVVAELRVGAAKSARPEHHDRQVSLILQPFAIVWPDEAALACYVAIRAELEHAGRSISEADLWIAAMTRAADGVLVTHNTGEFQRVPGLKLEDWLLP